MNHLRFQYATGNAAIATTLNPADSFRLVEIRVHLNAVGAAGNLTLTLDANQGSAYDLVIVTQDMSAVTDFIFQPDIPMSFENGDKLVCAWANGGGKTYGLTIVYEVI